MSFAIEKDPFHNQRSVYFTTSNSGQFTATGQYADKYGLSPNSANFSFKALSLGMIIDSGGKVGNLENSLPENWSVMGGLRYEEYTRATSGAGARLLKTFSTSKGTFPIPIAAEIGGIYTFNHYIAVGALAYVYGLQVSNDNVSNNYIDDGLELDIPIIIRYPVNQNINLTFTGRLGLGASGMNPNYFSLPIQTNLNLGLEYRLMD